jgi:hypothetical protein
VVKGGTINETTQRIQGLFPSPGRLKKLIKEKSNCKVNEAFDYKNAFTDL